MHLLFQTSINFALTLLMINYIQSEILKVTTENFLDVFFS